MAKMQENVKGEGLGKRLIGYLFTDDDYSEKKRKRPGGEQPRRADDVVALKESSATNTVLCGRTIFNEAHKFCEISTGFARHLKSFADGSILT